MTDERPSKVLGALPRTRPHRRSDKRPARPAPVPAGAADAVAAAARRNDTTNGSAPKPAAAKLKPVARPKGKRTTVKATTAKAHTTSAKAIPTPAAKATAKVQSTASAGGARANRSRLAQPAQPVGTPAPRSGRKPTPTSSPDVLGTAVHAAAELAEIGLSASARALRRAVSRLPRP